MRLNKTTLLFEDVSPEERQELIDWARAVVLQGKLPSPEPPWVDELVQAMGAPGPRLLILATVLPQRVLLSAVEPR